MLKIYNNKKKQLKLIEYLKNKLESNGVLFLQETHSISTHFFFRMVHPTPVVF